MLFKEHYSNNKKLVNYSKKIIRKIRTKEHTKPSGSSTQLHRIYHTCKCNNCKKHKKNVKILFKSKISEKEIIRKTEKMKKNIIEEIKKKDYFPKSLEKLSTLNDEEWDMFVPVIKMWLNDRTTLPDNNTTFEEIKQLVFDGHKKARLKLSKMNNFDNINELINNLSSEYNQIIKI